MSKRLVVEPKNYHGWELLPEGADVRCSRCTTGWVSGERATRHIELSRDEVRKFVDGDEDRCRRRATWVRRSSCGCGKCDVTKFYCSECLVVELMGEVTSRDRTIEGAVTLIRGYDPEIPTRNMVLLKIHGIEQCPPDSPDEYWKSCHQEKVS